MMRRGMRRGPGLVGTMARTAVIAGTATAVSGAVVNHQQGKQMEKQAEVEAQYQAQADATPGPADAGPARRDAGAAGAGGDRPGRGSGTGPRGRRVRPARPAHPAPGAEGRRRPERRRVRRRKGEAPRELIPTGLQSDGPSLRSERRPLSYRRGCGRVDGRRPPARGDPRGIGSGRDRRRRPPRWSSIVPTPRTHPSGRSSPAPGPCPIGRAPATTRHGRSGSSSPMTPT